MKWIELTIDSSNEAVDWVCTLLTEVEYISNIHIRKYQQGDAVPPPWTFTIYFYIPNDFHANARMEKIANLLLPLHRTGIATALHMAVVENQPESPEQLSPHLHRIGKRFVVLSAEMSYTPQAPEEVILKLKTSLAFGSGLHPATILCLQLLERYITPGMNVLDLGSGSGILSVAMAKLGASVLAVDNDPIAFESTQDAVNRNGVEQQVRVMQGSLGNGSKLGHWMGLSTLEPVPKINTTEKFDLIVANILARMHITLAGDYQQALHKSDTQAGILITSGFTADSEETVNTALTQKGFKPIDCQRYDEWVALVHQYQG
ncbi:MAG: 50S ribosomal protein L11 methyltransferase [Nostocaceae cyanobacterium]|nr:50S ribosomal protein L11 methyltransferase [Nostocaceae cyanobacterium]